MKQRRTRTAACLRSPARLLSQCLILLGLGCGSETALEPLLEPMDLENAEWSVQERYRELRGQADAALGSEPRDPERLLETQAELGRWLYATRYAEPARRALANAQRLDPSDRQWPYLLARLAVQRGDQDSARRHLVRTLELDPDYAPAQVALAQLEIGLGDVAKARSMLEPLAERGVDRAVYDLAKIDLDEGAFLRAVERLRSVVASQPDSTAAHQLLAMALRSAGQEDQAREHMERAMVGGTAAAWETEGLREPGMPDPILAATQVLRTDSRRLLDQAAQAARQGRHRQAVELYERALQSAPELATPRVRYATYLMQRGRGPRALALLGEALSIDPLDGSARYRLAALLVQSGESEQAITHLEQVVAADPRNVPAHLLLADQYERLGRDETAVDRLESLLVVDPNSVAAARRLIRHHFDAQSCDLAAARADQTVTLHRDDASFAAWKAWIDLWCGRSTPAQVRQELEAQARTSTSLDSGMVDALWAQVYAQALQRAGRHGEAARLQAQVVDVLSRPGDGAERSAASRRLSAYRRGEPGPRSLPLAGIDRYVPAPPALAEAR